MTVFTCTEAGVDAGANGTATGCTASVAANATPAVGAPPTGAVCVPAFGHTGAAT
ncbi:hypothetical protein ACFW1A_36060 [Kitasatospora sp. NPDC058965]|uniref:hypothetical protein n=1 Tax=Kitasatospora sp. NPDC058965 TaxID=3346682 RepID=UPI0036B9CAF9